MTNPADEPTMPHDQRSDPERTQPVNRPYTGNNWQDNPDEQPRPQYGETRPGLNLDPSRYAGPVGPPPPKPSRRPSRNLIIVLVTATLLAICTAGACIAGSNAARNAIPDGARIDPPLSVTADPDRTRSNRVAFIVTGKEGTSASSISYGVAGQTAQENGKPLPWNGTATTGGLFDIATLVAQSASGDPDTWIECSVQIGVNNPKVVKSTGPYATAMCTAP